MCELGWKCLGVLELSALPSIVMADAERWAAGMPVPCYAIDDETAINVTDGTVEVASEGTGICSPRNAHLGQRAGM